MELQICAASGYVKRYTSSKKLLRLTEPELEEFRTFFSKVVVAYSWQKTLSVIFIVIFAEKNDHGFEPMFSYFVQIYGSKRSFNFFSL